jgi:GTPase SAR1 family protein
MYEITLETFFDTGLTSNEQKSVLQADGFLILYDVTNKFSLERAKIYYKKILQMRDPMHADAQSLWLHNSGPPTTSNTQNDTQNGTPRVHAPSSPIVGNMSPTTASSAPSKVPFVLGANKCDADQTERQVSVSEGLKLADTFNCPYMEVSSLKKIKTVEDLFREMVKTIDRTKKAQLKLQQRLDSQRERTNSFKLPKVGDLLPKSVSENDDANYVEMMKNRKRHQSVRNTITGGQGPVTSNTGVHTSPTHDHTGGTPDSVRH